jgi:hypothetical protein
MPNDAHLGPLLMGFAARGTSGNRRCVRSLHASLTGLDLTGNLHAARRRRLHAGAAAVTHCLRLCMDMGSAHRTRTQHTRLARTPADRPTPRVHFLT